MCYAQKRRSVDHHFFEAVVASVSEDLHLWLLSNLLSTNRGGAVLTEVFMQFSIREKKQKPLTHRSCLPTFWTIKCCGLQVIKLLSMILPSAHCSTISPSTIKLVGLHPELVAGRAPLGSMKAGGIAGAAYVVRRRRTAKAHHIGSPSGRTQSPSLA